MSFSDLTRSYSTFPSVSQTASLKLSINPIVVSTKAAEGPSNIPGSSIAAGITGIASKGTAAVLATSTSSQAQDGSGGINQDLALGLGLGLGISALIAVFVAVYILKSRKAQKADFERRAETIRETVETAKARPN
ncbi:hypothetical protein JCM5350_001738 [Sporobolomyces pararoseus]